MLTYILRLHTEPESPQTQRQQVRTPHRDPNHRWGHGDRWTTTTVEQTMDRTMTRTATDHRDPGCGGASGTTTGTTSSAEASSSTSEGH